MLYLGSRTMSRILRHLEAILEQGSVLAASRKLCISQPSLSQYVRRLEADYGITIFDRSVTPWALTEEGRHLIEAQKRIEAIDRECRQFFSDRKCLKTGEICIASTAYRTATLLNPVLAEFKRAYPGIMIRIEEGTTLEAALMVESGRADCGIVISSMVLPSLDFVPIYRERVLLGLPPSHPYAQAHPPAKDASEEADFKALDGTTFISMKGGQVFHSYYETLCSKFQIDLPLALETQSILTVPMLISSGLGAALVPSTIAEDCRRRGVALYSTGDILPVNEVSYVWLRGRYQSVAAKAFIAELHRHFLLHGEGETASKREG